MKIFKWIALVLFLGLFACKSTTNAVKMIDLEYTWNLYLIDNESPNKKDFPNQIPKLVFNNNSSFSGNDGCNGFSGDFSILNSKLIFNNVIATKIYCSDAKDGNLRDYLYKSDSIKIKEDKLIFIKNNKQVLVYIKE